MLKMARELFALTPDIRYTDYQERALFNHVLASIDPKDGRTCYRVPVGQGVQHEYQGMFDSFTCCVRLRRCAEFELCGRMPSGDARASPAK